jgi:dihydropteroate synthase
MGGQLVRPAFPLVMGILNATPDSFHAASRATTVDDALRTAERMLAEGAAVLDIGGASTRPGAIPVDPEVERERVVKVTDALHRHFPQALLSIDTANAHVADAAVQAGARMVNDVSAGRQDPAMFATVARAGVPMVLMHMQGEPRTMQEAPQYGNVVCEVVHFLSERVLAARQAGVADLLVDPGFGFGKNTRHNHELLHGLPALACLGLPLVVGLSRKRMVNEVLGTTPAEALNGTTVLNTMALLAGAHVLRVHDVKEAVQAVALTGWLPPGRS